jgi:uncharacterized peroxidase-related enzyme
MPKIPLLQSSDAPAEVQTVYLDFQRRMGFPEPPNFIKAQGHSLAVARGTWSLVQHVLVGGTLPRSLKEMMFVAVSRDRGCRYCEAAHLACCRMLGVDPETMSDLVNNVAELSPPRTRDLLTFAVKCARNPQSIDEADYAMLRGHGLSQAEILEAVAMSALAVYANIMADATGVEDDKMFLMV